jgi:anti-sigma regulatory factor (Ser/Thr protein kinase)
VGSFGGRRPGLAPPADAVALGERGVRAATFVADPSSTTAARRFAAGLAEELGFPRIAADVALCTSELAANALIHARGPFTVTVRRAGEGIRVDVIDPRPDQLPVIVPLVGTVKDLTERSTTGRGLQIVATLSDRWGVSTTNGAKAVWAEMSGQLHEGPSAPTIVLGHDPAPLPGSLVRFRSLPVRAAVASGIQTDEAAREVQLRELGHPTVGTPAARLLELLDETAHLRLAGRYAALRASAEDLERFDLDVLVTDELLVAVGELARLLADGPTHPASPTPLDHDVAAFRQWLAEETTHQRNGGEPRPCPLPT